MAGAGEGTVTHGGGAAGTAAGDDDMPRKAASGGATAAADGTPTRDLTDAQSPSDDCYVLFGSNTAALALYEALRVRGVKARISPTPRLARATCGTSLLVECEDQERILQAAREEDVPVESFVRLPSQIDPGRAHFC